MTDYKTLRIPVDAHAAARDSKRADETWGEFIQRCTDNPPAPREFVDADALAAELDTAAADGGDVDSEALAREIVRQFDYTALANQVADELQGRLGP